MNPKAVSRAKSSLRNAERAVNGLIQSKTYDDFTDHWRQFLMSFKAIYTTLTEGSKGHGKSSAWMGRKKHQRQIDPLLNFLFHARNEEMYGLEQDTTVISQEIRVVDEDGNKYEASALIRSLRIYDDGTATADIKTFDDRPAKIDLGPPALRLSKFVGSRDSKTYMPPAKHLGKKIESRHPIAIAKLAITYMESLVEEAEKLS